MGLWHCLQSPQPCPQEGTHPVALVTVKPGSDEDHQEKCLSQLYDHMPEGLTPLATLKNVNQRRQLGVYWLSRSLPPCVPFVAQLVLLTNSSRHAPRARLGEQRSRVIVAILDSETVRRSPLISAGFQSCVLVGSPRARASPVESFDSLSSPLMWKDTVVHFLRSHLRTGNELSWLDLCQVSLPPPSHPPAT